MRRSLVLSTILAATAVLGACTGSPTNNGGTNNVKPVSTATPAATATPTASPMASPVASPGKGTQPVNGNVKSTPEKKPVSTPSK